MNENYFNIIYEGLSGELSALPPEGQVTHFENYRTNHNLDRTVAICYLNRFLASVREGATCAVKPLEYLIDKCLQLSPFDIVNLRTPAVMADPENRIKIEILDKTNASPEDFSMIEKLNLKREVQDVSEFLRKLLQMFPNYALAAGLLLRTDHMLGQRPDWLAAFHCPKRLQDDFNSMLFQHYAAIGCADEAEALWAGLPPRAKREVGLNCAAEVARRRGDTQKAIERYERSFRLDPSQGAVYFRLRELKNPSVMTKGLLGLRRVAICLYTFNKGKVFESTLKSLAASNIGDASVTVLVNGCSDDSLAVAEAARALFPNNRYTVINLHVNIGAPAARNWLINLPENKDTDYVAFLDDDVDVQPDWLEWFLSVAETDPKIGVVGCKVVFPGQPAMYQYLFRYVSVAYNDLLRLSLGSPDHQYDTGEYDFIRETRSVMGCCHLLRTAALRDEPFFDIRFSPSQVDDIDHDLCLCLAGWKVMYCGLVACQHHQSSGVGLRSTPSDYARTGNAVGNDVKLYHKHFNNLERLRELDNLSLLPTGK
ncbi:MAG TPA: glycosyltransferase [Humidesulfovibrio sp.]|uniref:glycosyltransferase n=1 Tax=Humidesulfovibrio sp. TaxID=2910988 RepID=UPI002C68C4D2|nr:glycosyltransferase [Humidesulfovibrio sp.]HWR02707.1 glycosyltransferase [Humidesulfovibrio sp.]